MGHMCLFHNLALELRKKKFKTLLICLIYSCMSSNGLLLVSLKLKLVDSVFASLLDILGIIMHKCLSCRWAIISPFW